MIEAGMIEQGLVEVLCCPACKGDLKAAGLDGMECPTCSRKYPLRDGILVLLNRDDVVRQQDELAMRERVARLSGSSPEEILKVVSLHHSIPIMSARAKAFRGRIKPSEWILDVGSGTGYYWAGTSGGRLVLLDFAFGNLRAARALLERQNDILFVQADASRLPLKESSVSGLWSVQVTQHFPEEVLIAFLNEAKRVLKQEFLVEVYNLNPARVHRMIYRLLGKRLHLKGKEAEMVLNRLNDRELVTLWRDLASAGVRVGYSELFFHPDLRVRMNGWFSRFMENLFSGAPLLAKCFARQIEITLSSPAR